MSKAEVSIIVVSYNHGKFILECLNSILLQTYQNWELIVADDASKDDSVFIFEKWLDENRVDAKKVFHDKNTGLCRTLNECIPLCTGKYIKIIAADDFLHHEFLEKGIGHFNSLASDVGLVYTNIRFVDEASRLGDIKFAPESFTKGNVFKKLMAGNFMSAPTFLIRKEVYDRVGLYDENILIEDWEFSLRLSKQYSVDYIAEPLVFYRAHAGNISKSPKMQHAEWAILMKYEEDGKYAREVADYVKVCLYGKTKNNYILQKYTTYPHAIGILKIIIRANIPTIVFRVLNKLKLI